MERGTSRQRLRVQMRLIWYLAKKLFTSQKYRVVIGYLMFVITHTRLASQNGFHGQVLDCELVMGGV